MSASCIAAAFAAQPSADTAVQGQGAAGDGAERDTAWSLGGGVAPRLALVRRKSVEGSMNADSPRSVGSPRRIPSSPLRLLSSPRMQTLDFTATVPVWAENQGRFLECGVSDKLLDGQFACKCELDLGNGQGLQSVEETLEMRASGTFRYIAWCREGMLMDQDKTVAKGGRGQWIVLGGVYRLVSQEAGGQHALFLSVQTWADGPKRSAALTAPVKVVQGIFVRGRVLQVWHWLVATRWLYVCRACSRAGVYVRAAPGGWCSWHKVCVLRSTVDGANTSVHTTTGARAHPKC